MAAIGMALSPFMILELALRVIAPQENRDVAVDPYIDLQQQQALFELDTDANEWRIPEHRMNFFRPASFSAIKREDTKRIFVLGGSTVQGRPFSTETAFPTWMEMRLQILFPQVDFEVVNVGGISYASYRVSRLLNEVMAHSPDAVVLYTGHNEFLEDREYGEILNSGPLQTLINGLAGNIRIVSWLKEFSTPATLPRSLMSQEVDARLDHAGGLEKYHRDPRWRQHVERHFDSTFRAMVHQVRLAGIPIWVCTPACDLVNTPPFKVELSGGLSSEETAQWQRWWKIASDAQVPPAQRLEACNVCLSIDPLDAAAHYVAGRLLCDLGNVEEAREHLIAARDLDVCPLRATTAIEKSVVRIAEQEKIPIIQTSSLFDQRDNRGNRLPDQIADPELFVDHVHPSIRGHQILGKAIADSMFANELFSSHSGTQNPEVVEQRFEALAQRHLTGLNEAYYARGKQRLEGLRRWTAGRAGNSMLPDAE